MRMLPWLPAALMFALPACAAMPAPPVRSLTVQEIARRAQPTSAYIAMEDANGKRTKFGSGFCCGDGQVITNLHVVQGPPRGYVRLGGQEARLPIAGVSGIDVTAELAVLHVPGARADTYLSFGDDAALTVGDTVFTIGNPLGLIGTFAAGIVSNLRPSPDEPIFQITAAMSSGSSGGPVFNDRGEIVGVAVASVRDGQALNFAIPVRYLRALLGRLEPPRPLPLPESILIPKP